MASRPVISSKDLVNPQTRLGGTLRTVLDADRRECEASAMGVRVAGSRKPMSRWPWRLSKAAGGVKETTETLLVSAVLAVLAATTIFMMVELLK